MNRKQHILGYTSNGEKIVEITEEVKTRKLARKLAKNKMRRVKDLCKHDYQGQKKDQITKVPSYFAEHWKETVNYG